MRKIILFLITFFIFILFANAYSFTDQVYDDLNIIGTDKISEIFDNGDGTYSIYLETVGNNGKFDLTFKYEKPDDKYRYATATIELSDEIDYIDSEIISSAPISRSFDSTSKTLTWEIDLGIEPTDTFTSGAPFPMFLYPTNTLKITFSIPDDLYGDIAPIKKASYSFLTKGIGVDKTYNSIFFLRGIHKDINSSPELKKEYFSDSSMTLPIDGTESKGKEVYVKYTVTNSTSKDIIVKEFTDTISLGSWYDGQDYLKNSSLSFTSLPDGGIKILPGNNYIFIGTTILDELSKDSTTTFSGNFNNIRISETNIPKHSILSGNQYLEETGVGQYKALPRYKTLSLLGVNSVLPALEGNFISNGANCNLDANGKRYINALGNDDICSLDSTYVVIAKNNVTDLTFSLIKKNTLKSVEPTSGGSSPCIDCIKIEDNPNVKVPDFDSSKTDEIVTTKENDNEEEKNKTKDKDTNEDLVEIEKNKVKEEIKVKKEKKEFYFDPVAPIEPKKGEGDFIKYPKELPKTGVQDEIFNKGGLAGVVFRALVDIRLPSKETFRLAGSENKDLSYWLQVIPEQDRNKDKYIVIPSKGLVMPVNTVGKDKQEYKNFTNGENEKFYDYLRDGAVEIPGTSIRGYGEVGNKVIGGHSSYWYYGNSRYKTHFQKIIMMDEGEFVWIYEKNKKTGEFERYVYRVFSSYNTSKTDISILKPTNNKQLTLFTCTPIGGSHGRWIVKAEFVGY